VPDEAKRAHALIDVLQQLESEVFDPEFVTETTARLLAEVEKSGRRQDRSS
jgi:hypothetical protein